MITQVKPSDEFAKQFLAGRANLRRLLATRTARITITYTELELEALADKAGIHVDEVWARIREAAGKLLAQRRPL